MSNYCKRIAKRKKMLDNKITQAIAPTIEFIHNIGAKNIYIDFDNNKHTLSIYTPDVSLSKVEMLSNEMDAAVSALSTKNSTIRVSSK